MNCADLDPYTHYCIYVPPHLLQQQRGVDISTEAWKSAVDYAERLVVQAEKKLERQKRACASKVSKLEVRLFFYLFAIFCVDFYIFSQARNVTLLRNEREAYETVRCNNISMRKVDASLHTLLPHPYANRES